MDKGKGCCDGCDSCGSCAKGGTCSANSCMGSCKPNWSRVAAKVAIAILVFWAGMQFGEQKAFMRMASFDGFGGTGMMGGLRR